MSHKSDVAGRLTYATADKRGRVLHAYNQAAGPLERIAPARATDAVGAELTAIRAELHNIVQVFDQHYPGMASATQKEAAQLKQTDLARLALFVVGLLAAVAFFGVDWKLGIVSLVVVIVANVVAKKQISKRCTQVAHRSDAFALEASRRIGTLESLDGPATGLAARADQLFLSTLGDFERLGEEQRRQGERQMALQRRQHAAQMAVVNATLAATEASLYEQRAQTDLLRTRGR